MSGPVPCGSAPRCVASVDERRRHRVAPIGYTGTRGAARERLLAALAELTRVEVVTARADYVHAVARTRWLRFVDDLECWLPADQRLIHVRSASRVGYYDLGVNRDRVERLREAFNRAEG